MVFRLEDGAMVKLKVDLTRAGVATNFTNPDGTPNYNISWNIGVTVVPASKKFSMPKSQVLPQQPKESTMKPI